MISLINDDSVNLADLQNKIIEIQDYLNTRKNDIVDNMVFLNIENYTIDDNQYYKKTKRYDYSVDTLDTQKIVGNINIDENAIELNGRELSGKLYNGIKLLSASDNSYDWVEIPVKQNIDLSHAHEINIVFKNNNKFSSLFIVKNSGIYKDIDQTIIVSILENNLIIDNIEKVSNIFIR
mgnify:CR=1 FL=1|jgi:hypothetical protein